MFHIFTIDGRIEKKELDVTIGLGVDHASRLGFLIDNDNLYCDEAHDWVQIVSERCMEPLCMLQKTRENDLGLIIDQIHSEAYEDEKLTLRLKSAKNVLMERIMWIVAIPSITFLMIYGIRMFKGG